jgi:hypothetical protein
MVVVHQSAVANGTIEDFDFGPVGEPAALGRFLGFGSLGAHKLGLKNVFARHYPAISMKHKAGVNEGGWSLAMAYWLKQRLLHGLPRGAEGLLRGQ